MLEALVSVGKWNLSLMLISYSGWDLTIMNPLGILIGVVTLPVKDLLH